MTRVRQRRALDEYPDDRGRMTEDALFRAHGVRHLPQKPLQPLERPETAAHDRTGLRHGEPVSEGRTARNGDS